ncbi:MAG: hypothetical protein NW201_00110 [Gemmatimonadales bacterium]|nr:hypothetical protein [Gemmatimonadales bacterium]
MAGSVPVPLVVLFLGAVVAIPALVPAALAAGARRLEPPLPPGRVALAAGVVLAAWLVLVLGLVAPERGALGTAAAPVLFLGPLVLGAAGVGLLPVVRRTLLGVPLATLVRLQSSRVVGGLFLAWAAFGAVPWRFALIAGLGDVLVGVTAPFAARAAARGDRTGRRIALGHTLLGLLDFAVAIGTAMATRAALPWPIILIPGFLVPLAILLHAWTLLVLRRG